MYGKTNKISITPRSGCARKKINFQYEFHCVSWIHFPLDNNIHIHMYNAHMQILEKATSLSWSDTVQQQQKRKRKQQFCITEGLKRPLFLAYQNINMESKIKLLWNNTCIYTGELGLTDQYQRKEVFEFIIWTANERTVDTGLGITIVSIDIGKQLESEPLNGCVCC